MWVGGVSQFGGNNMEEVEKLKYWEIGEKIKPKCGRWGLYHFGTA